MLSHQLTFYINMTFVVTILNSFISTYQKIMPVFHKLMVCFESSNPSLFPPSSGNPGRGPAAGQTIEGHIYGGFSQNPYERRPGFPRAG